MNSTRRYGTIAAALVLGWLLKPSLYAEAAPPATPAPAAAPATAEATASSAEVQAIFDFFQKEAEVFVVSKTRGEKVSDAPGNVLVYTAYEIAGLGAHSLADLAGTTSGLGYYGLQYDQENFFVRGFSAGTFDNNRVAVQIDGITINSGRANRAFMGPEIPLGQAAQVEILKGPASSLYGTGAFLGVINIATKDLTAPGSMYETKVSASSPVNGQTIESSAVILNDEVKFKVFASHTNRDGSKQPVMGLNGNSGGPSGIIQDFQDQLRTTFLNTSVELVNANSWLKGLKLGAIYMDRQGGMGISWWGVGQPVDYLDFTEMTAYVEYKRALTDSLTLTLLAREQFYEESGLTTWFAPSDTLPGWANTLSDFKVPVYVGELKAELSYQMDETASMIAGVDYDDRFTTSSPERYDFYAPQGGTPAFYDNHYTTVGPIETWSAYAQAKKEFPVLAGLNAIAGVRYDAGFAPSYTGEGNNNTAQWSPRAGLVQKLSDDWTVKALYGTALKAPGLKEMDLNGIAPILLSGSGYYLPKLVPETIETFEASVVYHSKMAGATLTFFDSQLTNEIREVRNYGQNFYINMPGISYGRGVELQAELKSANGKAFVNYTHQESVDGAGDLAPGVPTNMASLGGVYNFTSTGTTIGLTEKWVGDITRRSLDTVLLSQNLGGWADTDINVTQKIAANMSLSLQVLNLMNSDQEVSNVIFASFPAASDSPLLRRQFVASLSSKF